MSFSFSAGDPLSAPEQVAREPFAGCGTVIPATYSGCAMIGFAGAAVLYDTSNIIRYYPEDRYVSAAMQLFASIALMFWYVLRLLMGNRN